MRGDMKKVDKAISIYSILGIALFLILAVIFDYDKYLFKYSFVTAYGFFLIGKYVRDYEIKRWNRRNGIIESDEINTKGDV
jgi:hypothetical protein